MYYYIMDKKKIPKKKIKTKQSNKKVKTQKQKQKQSQKAIGNIVNVYYDKPKKTNTRKPPIRKRQPALQQRTPISVNNSQQSYYSNPPPQSSDEMERRRYSKDQTQALAIKGIQHARERQQRDYNENSRRGVNIMDVNIPDLLSESNYGSREIARTIATSELSEGNIKQEVKDELEYRMERDKPIINFQRLNDEVLGLKSSIADLGVVLGKQGNISNPSTLSQSKLESIYTPSEPSNYSTEEGAFQRDELRIRQLVKRKQQVLRDNTTNSNNKRIEEILNINDELAYLESIGNQPLNLGYNIDDDVDWKSGFDTESSKSSSSVKSSSSSEIPLASTYRPPTKQPNRNSVGKSMRDFLQRSYQDASYRTQEAVGAGLSDIYDNMSDKTEGEEFPLPIKRGHKKPAGRVQIDITGDMTPSQALRQTAINTYESPSNRKQHKLYHQISEVNMLREREDRVGLPQPRRVGGQQRDALREQAIENYEKDVKSVDAEDLGLF